MDRAAVPEQFASQAPAFAQTAGGNLMSRSTLAPAQLGDQDLRPADIQCFHDVDNAHQSTYVALHPRRARHVRPDRALSWRRSLPMLETVAVTTLRGIFVDRTVRELTRAAEVRVCRPVAEQPERDLMRPGTHFACRLDPEWSPA